MQSCNIAAGAVCNYTNTIASVPTSEISRSGVGVSQQISQSCTHKAEQKHYLSH